MARGFALAAVVAVAMVVVVTADCTSYCNTLATNCVDFWPFSATDVDTDDCLKVCATYPSDNSQWTSSSVGNTQQCREYHANAAASSPATHCIHAGPGGGGSDALCGTTCEGYCNVMTSSSSTIKADLYDGGDGDYPNIAPFTGAAQCQAYCANFFNADGYTMTTGVLNGAVTSGNNVECRLYHATVAQILSEATHWLHALPASEYGGCLNASSSDDTDYNAISYTYCDRLGASCGYSEFTAPYKGQFQSYQNCLDTAEMFKRGNVNDQSNNNMDCRLYHAGVAGDASVTPNHCYHSGGNGENICGVSWCESYCFLIQGTCDDEDTEQFYLGDETENFRQCMQWCATYPTTGNGGDATNPMAYSTSGNTLQCRLYHVGAALNDPDVHCNHAGPSGGDSESYCGTACDAFCTANLAACSGLNAQYTDMAQCMGYCEAMDDSIDLDEFVSTVSGSNLACRAYHTSVALNSTGQATIHCPHTGPLGGAVLGTPGPCGSVCDAYCQGIQTACQGSDAQYVDTENLAYDNCMTNCALFPAGTLQDTAGNTLGCRLYHMSVALSNVGVNADLVSYHCPHAGPTGADVCGSQIDAFCQVEIAACGVVGDGDGNGQYTSVTDCQTKAAQFVTGGIPLDATNFDDLQCRAYHAGVALTDDADLHCPHTAVISATCNAGLITPCDTYCNTTYYACQGANTQYADIAACLETCSLFPVGSASDTSGNTLGCRAYHAGVALNNVALGNAALVAYHCPHGGPTGGSVCGSQVDAFCQIEIDACGVTGDGVGNGQYSSYGDCQTKAALFNANGIPLDATNYNTLQCRAYHAGVALDNLVADDTANVAYHCPHTGVTSTPCSTTLATSTGSSSTTGTTGGSTTGSTTGATTGSTTSTTGGVVTAGAGRAQAAVALVVAVIVAVVATSF